MGLKFGTSGLRGLSVDLEGRPAAVYATAFARHLVRSGQAKTGDPVLVGRDFRDSSPGIASIVIGALSRAGFVPLDCATVPTPALALYGLSLKAASLMVTGSHIPADRNGIKFYRPDGEIDKADEQAIAAIAADIAEIDEAPGVAEDRSAECAALFRTRNVSVLPENALAGLRIGIYQHSTVARDLMVDILAHYGAETVALGRSETFIPVDTEAVSPETVGLLGQWTREHGLDAIVSADGDGDRPLLSDETGTPLRGDLLGLVTARFLAAEVVATPVTSNSGIEANGRFRVVRTRVGSPYVIAAMTEALADGKSGVMGFEANGGLLLGSPFTVNGRTLAPLPTRDSILPLLATLYAAAAEKKPLSAVAASFRLPAAAADRLENYPLEKSGALMAYLRASRANLETFLASLGTVAEVSDIDGLRVSLRDGSTVHFRPSGNAPEMRCYVEAATEEDAHILLEKGLALLRNFSAAP
ncbi:phosphomannomutase [Rhizobiaceae bacterium BDR2-2]|uniref:Phosphomannomutase n=1 Tax=Ectorhizobium quercum TaxID=2965071 RepID=A0AAE3N4Z6_9HYPH|nr:phosphomannomutase [Ectorhizobium quercum]MCX9000036.1 phosphomannomutase [Ectorhizobium quercum]